MADATGGHATRGGDRSDEMMLPGQAQNWPTPDTQNHRDGNVRREEQKGSHALSLHHAVDAWATPTASMTTGAGTSGRDGGPNLQTQSEAWATPTGHESWLTPSANEDAAATVDGKMQQMLTQQAKRFSHLGPESEGDGLPSLPDTPNSRRQLAESLIRALWSGS